MPMLALPIKQTTVDMRTGKVTAETTIQAGLMLPAVKPGECDVCHKPHPAEAPHNVMSLPYQYRFYAEHGRWPDWRDAMAHCSPEVIQQWRGALSEMGVDIDAGQLQPERA